METVMAIRAAHMSEASARASPETLTPYLTFHMEEVET